MMKKLTLLLALVALVKAHDAQAVVYMEIPCKNLPAEAVKEVPDLLAGVGKIACTPYGQMLEPTTGYWWPYNNIQPVLIPAQKETRNPLDGASKFYFTDFDVKEMKGDEKQKMLDQYYDLRMDLDLRMTHSSDEEKEKYKQRMLTDRAKNLADLNKAMRVFHVVALSSDNGFARDIYFFKTAQDGVIFGLTFMADQWRLFGIAKVEITDFNTFRQKVSK